MRRFQLTELKPENTKTGTRALPPDIRQKLEAYQTNREEHENMAPDVRPYPLEKYDIQKDAHVVMPEEIPPKKIERIQRKSITIKLGIIPAYARPKAITLLPLLQRMNLGGLDLNDVLHDLTAHRAKRIRSDNPILLESITRQLNEDSRVPKNLFRNLFADGKPDTAPAPGQNVSVFEGGGHPTKARSSKRLRMETQEYSKPSNYWL